MSQRPIMPWDSQDAFDPEGKVVWWTRLDKRYQVEVQRKGDYEGTLFIWDHEDEDGGWIMGRAVTLSYAARFGPDVADVAEWQNIAIELVDSRPGETS